MTLNRSLFTSYLFPDLLGKVALRYLLMGLCKVNENINLKYQIQYLQDKYSRNDIPILSTELNFPICKINHLGYSLAVNNKAGNLRSRVENKDEGNIAENSNLNREETPTCHDVFSYNTAVCTTCYGSMKETFIAPCGSHRVSRESDIWSETWRKRNFLSGEGLFTHSK